MTDALHSLASVSARCPEHKKSGLCYATADFTRAGLPGTGAVFSTIHAFPGKRNQAVFSGAMVREPPTEVTQQVPGRTHSSLSTPQPPCHAAATETAVDHPESHFRAHRARCVAASGRRRLARACWVPAAYTQTVAPDPGCTAGGRSLFVPRLHRLLPEGSWPGLTTFLSARTAARIRRGSVRASSNDT
jgi:hypothetical protein